MQVLQMARSGKKNLMLWWWKKRVNRIYRPIRRFSVHPINRSRHMYGEYHHLIPELLEDGCKFVDYLRMQPDTFHDLINECAADLKKESTNFCRPISSTERLVVTLRFLATGESFRSLSFYFRMGLSTVQTIVKTTVNVLWNKLQPLYMPVPDEATWTKAADDFYQKWNFPLCVGAIDGKHVQLIAPFHSGSQYYSYKKNNFSIVLIAVVDANGKFLVIDVGGYGSCSDGGIFQASSFFKLLKSNKLHLPQQAKIPGTDIELPHMFVDDGGFALMPNLMRPFPSRALTNEKRIFNYRLSRARRQVECSFGIVSSMWRILRKPIEVHSDFAVDIVKAVCVLHNYIQDKEPERIRCLKLNQQEQRDCQLEYLASDTGRIGNEAISVRNTLMSYFMSPAGSLPWQNNMLFTDV